MFLGQEHIRSEKLKIKSEKLQNTVSANQEQTFLFMSLMIKNHLKSIKEAVEDFMGDHELHKIKKHTREMERLIEKFEKS